MSWPQVIRPETLVFLIPISAILVCGMLGIVKLLIKHRERMAMIEQGMHPDVEHYDSPQEQELSDIEARR